MPSATFVADFSQFQSGVNAATATLKGLEGESNKVATALEAMGASTKDVDLKKYADETQDAAKATGGLQGTVMELAGAFGLLFTVGSAVNFAKTFVSGVFESASALVDMKQKTGLTIDTLQRLQAVGVESGVSMSDFAAAAYNLGVKLSTGGGSVREAVDDLKLSYDNLKAANPDEQFKKTVQALSEMTNEQERNRIGQELFGNAWKTIAPAIAAGYQDIANAARVSTDAQVEALNDLSADYERMKNNLHTAARSEIASLFLIRDAVKTLPPGLVEVVDQTNETKLSIEQLDEVLIRAAKHWHDIPLPVDTATKSAKDYTAQLGAAQMEVDNLTATQRKGIDAALALGEAQDKIQETYFKTEGALKLYITAQQDAAEKAREQIAITREAVKETEKMEALWAKVAAVETTTTAETEAFGKALLTLGTHVPKPELDAYTVTLENLKRKTKELTDASMAAALAQDAINAAMGTQTTTAQTAAEKVNKLVGEINAQGGMATATAEQMMALDAAQKAAANAAQNLGGKVDGGSDSMLRMTQVMIGMAAGTYSIASAFDQATASLDAYAHALSAGNLNATPGPMIINPGGSVGPLAPGSRMPSFQSGGSVGQTGMAYLHAGEYVVPRGGMGGGSGTTINISVTQPLGTPTEIARVVGEALTVQLKTLGIRQPWTG